MWGPKKRFVYVAPCVTSGLSPRSVIPSVMAPGQSVGVTLRRACGSWKNRLFPFFTLRLFLMARATESNYTDG